MRRSSATYSWERLVPLADLRRRGKADDPEHVEYLDLLDRVRDNNFAPDGWQAPETYRLAGPPSLSAPVGAGGANLGMDVAQIEEALLSLDGLGLSGWLARTGNPGPRLNASIVAFQGLNGLEPDGLINPGGPTLATISRKLPPPERDMIARGAGDAPAESRAEEARFEAALEAERRAADPFGDIFGGRGEDPVIADHVDRLLAETEADIRAQKERDMTARGIGDTLAERRAKAAFEAERRAEDPFGDIFGGRGEDPVIADHVDKWLAEDAADIRAQMERDAAIGSPNAPGEQANYVIGDAGADRLEPQLLSMNNSQRDQIIDITMDHEGGWSEEEAKAGRPTNYGITQTTLDSYNDRYGDAGFPELVSQLKEKQARQIARQLYYEEYGIGDIDEFSVAAHVFDVVFNSSLTGAALMLQDAMWETIRGTDLETKFTRDMLPGSTVPEQEWAKTFRITGTTIDVLNSISERGLIEAFHNNLVDRRTEYMRWVAERNPEKANVSRRLDYSRGVVSRLTRGSRATAVPRGATTHHPARRPRGARARWFCRP